MVQNPKERSYRIVEFKQLFGILKKHLSDGADIPDFFRDLIAMCTDVSENEMGTEKDPSAKLTDNTIRTYIKRGALTKAFAKSILYRISSETIVESINSRSDESLEFLADDLQGYDPSITAENAADFIAQWLVEIVQKAAGLIPSDELAKQKQQQTAVELKAKYGDFLLNEAGEFCTFPGCGKTLTITKDGSVQNGFEVSLIDKSKAAKPANLLAMCPRCYAIYLLDDDPKLCKELKNVKTVISERAQSIQLLDDLSLENGIIGVIRKVANLKEKDLQDAAMNPHELAQKLTPAEDMALYLTVKTYVLTYFVRIKEIMMNLDKRSEIDYGEVQDQMHAIYKRLKKAKRSNMEIFNEIVNKVQHASMQPATYCQIVVAYFVQSCEVFDAIAE